jgi:outer membrane immunogenic protein
MKTFSVLAALAVGAGLGFVQVANAADMPMPHRVVADPPPSWTGAYIGFHAGYGWTTDATGTAVGTVAAGPSPFGPLTISQNSDGAIAGLQLGYNWQFANSWVAGIEADASGTGLKGSQFALASGPGCPGGGTPCNLVTMSERVDWLASARGRLGYLIGSGMAYATGGVAFAGVNFSGNGTAQAPAPGTTFPTASTSTRTGYVVGAGYEAPITSSWLIRGEFLHYHFDGRNTSAPGVGLVVPGLAANYAWGALNINMVRLGLDYKFN